MGLSNNLGKLSNMITSTGSAVGIAQASPAYTLDVSGTGRFTSTLLVSGAATFSSSVSAAGNIITSLSQAATTDISVTNTSVSNGAAAQISAIDGGASQIDIVAFGSGSTGTLYGITKAKLKVIRDNSLTAQTNGLAIGTDAAVPLYMFTNSTVRATITSAGNVGINTSSPTSISSFGKILQIDGGAGNSCLALSGNSLAGQANIGYDNSILYIDAIGAATGANNTITFNTTSLNSSSTRIERMRITSGGSVIVQSVRNNTFASSGNLQIFDNTNNIGWGFQNNTFNNLVVYSYNGVWNTVGYFTNGTGAYVALSDANKKKDFEDSTIGLKEVLQLKPTLYRMKSEDETTDKHLGFIAQEVKNLIPQAYNQNGEDGDDDIFIGLTEMPIIAALTKAIQEMNTKLDEQNQTIQNLQEQINAK